VRETSTNALQIHAKTERNVTIMSIRILANARVGFPAPTVKRMTMTALLAHA